MGPGLTVNTATGSLQWSDKWAPSAVICPFDLYRSHQGAEGGWGGGMEARGEGGPHALSPCKRARGWGISSDCEMESPILLPVSLRQ